MKVVIYLKDPDGFSEGIAEAVTKSFTGADLDEDEKEALFEKRQEKLDKALETWVEYSECVTIEFDTTTKEARVLTLAEAKG